MSVQVAIPVVYGGGEDDETEVEEYGGYVARVTDAVYERVKPRWSQLQREKLIRASQPSDDITLRRLLHGFPADWANSFARHNKLIGLERGMGEFVPRVPVAHDAGEGFKEVELEAYDVLESYRFEKKKAEKPPVPKYYLHQVFSDVSVAEKLSLDAGMMIVVSRVAVGDPKAACDLIVKHARENGFEVSVRVGDYATGRKASRQRLLEAAAGLSVEPYTCEVVGNKILVTGVSGVGSAASWTVSSQLWQMPELDAVYRLSCAKGISVVNALFTLDMVKLGIELVSDVDEDYGFDVQLHVGEYDESVSGNRVSLYGQDVVGFSKGVFPVVYGGKVVATAIYAGERQVYVNWHVITGLVNKSLDEDSFVSVRLHPDSDDLCRLSLVNEVASDVWIAELDLDDTTVLDNLEPPVCRVAVPGEEVVAVYAVPVGVECTDGVRVENVDVGMVCLPRFPQARSGMSGAAIVALSDGALLGSYTGSNRSYSLGSSLCIKESHNWIAGLTAPIVAPQAFITGKGASALYRDLKARGLGDDIASISSSIRPLLSAGRRVGNQYLHAGGAVTMLDPGVWDLVDESGDALDFVPVRGAGVRKLLSHELAGPIGRRVQVDELVFAVHKDDEGVIFSDILTVNWVSSDGTKCRLTGVPTFEGKSLKGSVLVALSDCSPLGLVGRHEEAQWGLFAECVTWAGFFSSDMLSMEEVAKKGLFDKLSSRFTYLKTSTWDANDVRSLVVGDTAAAGSYARVGAAAVLATVLGRFHQQDIQDVERVVTSRFSDDSWMLSLCGRVLPGREDLFGVSRADKLDTVKIFFGLVYLREGANGLDYVLDELGLFDLMSYEGIDSAELANIPRPRSI